MRKQKNEPNEKRLSGANGKPFRNSISQLNGRKTELFNYRLNGRKNQCSRCFAEADYLSFDKLCADCEQQGEFIWREILSPIQKAEFLREVAR